jgi:probable rRNA maturation factor
VRGGVSTAAAARVAARVREAARPGGLEVHVSFVDDDEMRALNARWRGVDRTTDVLSFAGFEGEALPGAEGFLGDLVISLERAEEQAAGLGHSALDEVAVLVAHGLLHLLGLDHERGDDEARRQAELEMTLLDAAGVDPSLALVGRGW